MRHHALGPGSRLAFGALAFTLLSACSTPGGGAPGSSAAAVAASGDLAKPGGAPGASASSAREVKAAKLGEPAPDFTLTDTEGKPVTLSALRGKIVVLEWFNPECPFVKTAHEKHSLKTMAKRVMAANPDVAWLAINSNGPGKQAHGAEVNREGKRRFDMAHPVLLDETGQAGKAYGAERTPHMFVIDKAGVLVYRGAIDSSKGGEPEAADPVVNYVDAALADLAAGKPVATADTKAFGCSVKYASR